ALKEAHTMCAQINQLQQEIEDEGILKQEALVRMDRRLRAICVFSEQTTGTLRELLFGAQRRILALLVVGFVLMALIAASWVPHLERFF
ncbi:MAG: hypothetical protein AAGJ35_09930, partial [Myxococcota bacterium]